MISKQKITLFQNNSLNLLHIKQKFRNTTQITINFEVQKSLTILPYTNNLLKKNSLNDHNNTNRNTMYWQLNTLIHSHYHWQ